MIIKIEKIVSKKGSMMDEWNMFYVSTTTTTTTHLQLECWHILKIINALW